FVTVLMIPALVSNEELRARLVDALPGVASDLWGLLGVCGAVSIALHIAIWSRPASPDDPQAHIRAGHQYVFALAGVLVGVVSASAGAVIVINAFVNIGEQGFLPMVSAIGA